MFMDNVKFESEKLGDAFQAQATPFVDLGPVLFISINFFAAGFRFAAYSFLKKIREEVSPHPTVSPT